MLRSHKAQPVPRLIGWKEVVDLPEWGVRSLVAKSDTGARSSALDVKNIRVVDEDHVAFEIVVDRKNRSLTQEVTAPILKKTRVKSSNGKISERYTVRTVLRIGEVRRKVDFSLVCRKRMICRILLGRKALAPDLVVHPEEKYLLSKRKRPRISQITHRTKD